MRDDFNREVKRTVADRVGNHCSNPECKALTSGPQIEETKSLNVGVAAHITAASSNGPRYNPNLSPEKRKAASNAIWLCQTCAKLVDNDKVRFTELLLRKWKCDAEKDALTLIGKTRREQSESSSISRHNNDLDYFPNLNRTALTKHIKVLINNPRYPYNHLIERLTLYQGLDDLKYVLVVEVPETNDNYLKFMNHWQPGDLRFLVNDSFNEVYQDKTTTGPYLDDWLIWVKSPDEEFPDGLILKDYYWLLFEKT